MASDAVNDKKVKMKPSGKDNKASIFSLATVVLAKKKEKSKEVGNNVFAEVVNDGILEAKGQLVKKVQYEEYQTIKAYDGNKEQFLKLREENEK